MNFADGRSACFGGAVFQVRENPSNHSVLSDEGEDMHGRTAFGVLRYIMLTSSTISVEKRGMIVVTGCW